MGAILKDPKIQDNQCIFRDILVGFDFVYKDDRAKSLAVAMNVTVHQMEEKLC